MRIGHGTSLRNYFERRQALVEIDVIAAMALGLSLEDLEMIYTIQFPVLQQNENDTWYDQKGNIVFTCSKGLTGVGVDRKRNSKTGMLGWEDIRGEQIDENTYAGIAPTHTHTIDPAKSELYGGQQVTYTAPTPRATAYPTTAAPGHTLIRYSIIRRNNYGTTHQHRRFAE